MDSSLNFISNGQFCIALMPSEKAVCPESTIESANRRNFVKRAALTATAVGVGSTLLAGNILPGASAKSNSPKTHFCCICTGKLDATSVYSCNLGIFDNVYLDISEYCNGNPNHGITGELYFGGCCTGERIGSQRHNCTICGYPPGKNLEGLDFYTGSSKRLSITNSGQVGIGTCSPCHQLQVVAPNQQGIRIQGPSSCVGAALSFQTTGSCCQGWEILDTGTKAGQGVKKLNIRNLNTSKDIFTICGPGSVIGINTIDPAAALEVTSPTSSVPAILGKSCGAVGVYGESCSSFGLQGSSAKGTGIFGSSCSPTGTGVYGKGASQGVYGYSTGSNGVYGYSASKCGVGVYGSSSGIGVKASAFNREAIPLVAQGALCQSSPLQEWLNACGTPLGVVNKCGWLGVGTSSPGTPLQVNGGLSAKTTIATSNYTMSALDFGVLANASSAALKVTLPPASTALGMMVLVKKIDSSTNAVTIAASGTNKVDGKASQSLAKQYDSYELISDGSSNWYIAASATK